MTHRVTNLSEINNWFLPIALVLLVIPFVLPQFHLFLLIDILLLAIFAVAFNLLYGYTGYLSFGHAMFTAVSGYTLAIFLLDVAPSLGIENFVGGIAPLVTFFLAVVIAVLASVIVGITIGYLSVQLEEIYFAMLTLSFSMAIFAIAFKDIGGLTNGSDGLTVILSTANVFGIGIPLGQLEVYYYITLIIFVPSIYALWRIAESPFGLVCKAIRENNERVEATGINTTNHVWVAFIISGFFSGITGALLVPLRTIINPSIAHWTFSAEPVLATIIGGSSYFAGPILGAFVFRYLRWSITQHELLEAHWQLVLGIMLLTVIMFFQAGVYGSATRVREWGQRLIDHYHEGGSVISFILNDMNRILVRLRGDESAEVMDDHGFDEP